MLNSARAFLAVAALAVLSVLPASAANITLDGNLVVPNVCTVTGTSPQTCNATSGAVTTGTLTTAAATNAAYTINNSAVAATSRVNCQVLGYSGTIVTNGYPQIISCVPGAGTITVNLTNTHAANALNGTVVIGFWVVN
jgi:hypothetical protein